MRNKCNVAVRKAAEEEKMFLWEVAELLGMSEATLMRKLRVEWSKEEQKRVIALIKSHSAGRSAGNG